jgi:exopolyphosphatase / guanosine-5'-triphosphate,3'-diphosphate pyrophosphatase
VKHYVTAATSAMRDAANSKQILSRIKKETSLDIKVISGEDEASYIYESHVAESLSSNESYLYIDVGGGSTELTFFSDGKLVTKQSFNIGTIRLLKNQVTEDHWDEMKRFIKQKTIGYHHITAIGSGGNINKIFSLSKRKEGRPLALELLRNYYKEFSSISLSQRISLYQLREDRADVVVPALLIYINVMRWADADEIFVPKIGLADGLIHILYEQVKNGIQV